MPYEIIYDKAVRNQLATLPGHIKTIARQQIASLSDDPRPPRSKELAGHPSYYRLWLSANYRLVWRIFDDEQLVEIEYVGPKLPDLYNRLGLSRPGPETET